jgi:hypothetical protein
MSYSAFAQKLNKEIKCPNLKELLFATSDIDASDIKGIGAINMLLTFGFIVAFIKWKNDSLNKYKFPVTPNAKRVFDSFSCVYNGEKVGLDLIIYVLTEMQMDEATLRERSYFRDIISGSQDTLQIPTLRNLIKTWFQSAKHVEDKEDVLLEKFTGLYNVFPFLPDMEVVFKKEENSQFETMDLILVGQALDTRLILVRNEYGVYYLSSYENIADNNNSKLTYYTLNGVHSFQEKPPKGFLQRASIMNSNSRPTSIFAKSLFSLSFKYIKNLSLSLSDTITTATKQKLYEHFKNTYSDVFKLGVEEFNELIWDNIITILMIEEGPTELLELILDSDGFYFERILENLGMRYNAPDFANKVKSVYDSAQANELAEIKRHIDDSSSIIKNISAINRTLMAKGIINGLASLENNKKRSGALFVESLAVRIKNIDKIIASADSNKSKAIKINKALEKTFRYMIPFYYGIFAYQQEKEDLLNDIETKNLDMDKVSRDALFAKCEHKFFDAAKESISKICRMTLGQLVGDFRTLCQLVFEIKEHKKGQQIKLSPKGILLKSAIGRERICSQNTFDKLLNIEPNDSITMDKDSIPKDITKFINNEKHDTSHDVACANIILFNQFLIRVKHLLYFLIYNENFQEEMILGQQVSYDPIYPYVVRYSTKSENRDGYNINSFTIFPFDDTMRSEIKILSERDYEIDEKYYCIPNENTSNSRWWIEPFLISCRKYDQLILSYFSKNKKIDKEEGEGQ